MSKNKTIFSVLSDLETLTCEVRQALDSLTVYSDAVGEELRDVRESEVWTALLFCSRLPMFDAVLQLSREKLANCLVEMEEAVKAGYALAGRSAGAEDQEGKTQEAGSETKKQG